MTKQITEQLIELTKELYEEGYMCGISEPNASAWYAAWAEAMQRVANGAPYTPNLVIEIFHEQSGSKE